MKVSGDTFSASAAARDNCCVEACLLTFIVRVTIYWTLTVTWSLEGTSKWPFWFFMGGIGTIGLTLLTPGDPGGVEKADRLGSMGDGGSGFEGGLL